MTFQQRFNEMTKKAVNSVKTALYPRNNLAQYPCAFNHLAENPHPEWRFASDIGWFRKDPESGEFLYDAKGPDNHSSILGKPSERGKIMTGPHSFIFCLADMSQATLDSLPGTKEPKAARVGFGAHWHAYCDPQVLRHLKSYPKGDPRHPNSGKWAIDGHVSDDWKFGSGDNAPLS